MTYYYSDPSRETDPHALPDVEVFEIDDPDYCDNPDEGGEPAYKFSGPGWYYWFCFPGCLPDGEPIGPYETEELAVADMREHHGLDLAETVNKEFKL